MLIFFNHEWTNEHKFIKLLFPILSLARLKLRITLAHSLVVRAQFNINNHRRIFVRLLNKP